MSSGYGDKLANLGGAFVGAGSKCQSYQLQVIARDITSEKSTLLERSQWFSNEEFSGNQNKYTRMIFHYVLVGKKTKMQHRVCPYCEIHLLVRLPAPRVINKS